MQKSQEEGFNDCPIHPPPTSTGGLRYRIPCADPLRYYGPHDNQEPVHAQMRRALSLQLNGITSRFGLGDLWPPTSSRRYLELLDCESLVFRFFQFQYETSRTNHGRMLALSELPALTGPGQDSRLYHVLRNILAAFDMSDLICSPAAPSGASKKRDKVKPEQLT